MPAIWPATRYARQYQKYCHVLGRIDVKEAHAQPKASQPFYTNAVSVHQPRFITFSNLNNSYRTINGSHKCAIFLLTALILWSFVCLPATALTPITVQGRWRFIETHFVTTTSAIPFAKVEVYDNEPAPFAPVLLRSGYTDGNGYFSFTDIENNDGLPQEGGLDIYVTLSADYALDSSKCASVKYFRAEDGAVCIYSTNTEVHGNFQGGTIDIGTKDISESQNTPWKIYSAAYRAYYSVKAIPPYHDNEKVPIYWPHSSPIRDFLGLGETAYCASLGLFGFPIQYYISCPLGQVDRDDIYHEYGHAIMFKLCGNFMPPSYISPLDYMHVFRSETDYGFALREGWAEFFTEWLLNWDAIQLGREYYYDFDGQETHYADLNDRTNAQGQYECDGAIVEGAVAEAFWDICDGGSDDDDGITAGIGLQDLLIFLRDVRPTSILELAPWWQVHKPSSWTSLQKILNEAKIVSNQDASTPPAPINIQATVNESGQPVFMWSKPPGSDDIGYLILRKHPESGEVLGFPVSEPLPQSVWRRGSYSESPHLEYCFTGTVTSAQDTNVVLGRSYRYVIASYDNIYNYSDVGIVTLTSHISKISLAGSLNYGKTEVGTVATRSINIHNEGTVPITVTDIHCPPGFSAHWSGEIVAGGSATVIVTFSPDTDEQYTGQIMVESDALWGPRSLSCSGTGWYIARWDGGGNSGGFQNSLNWYKDIQPNWGGDFIVQSNSGADASIQYDYPSWVECEQFLYQASYPIPSVMSGSGNGIIVRQKLENYSSWPQTLSIPLAFTAGWRYEINPVFGDIVLQGSLANNGGHDLWVWGQNIPGIGRMLTLEANAGWPSSGEAAVKVSIAGNSTLNLKTPQHYTGETDINFGELRLSQGGSIKTNGTIYIGHGAEVAADVVATLAINSSSLAVSNRIWINPGIVGTRQIEMMSSSGSGRILGDVELNSSGMSAPLNILCNAASSLRFEGVIRDLNGGTSPVTVSGPGLVIFASDCPQRRGTTTITGGTLQLGLGGSSGDAGSGQIDIGPSATLSISRNDSPVFPNSVTLMGTNPGIAFIVIQPGHRVAFTNVVASAVSEFWLKGGGTLALLNDSNTLSNSIVVQQGTIETPSLSVAGSGSALGNGAIFIGQSGSGSLKYTGLSASTDRIGPFALQGIGVGSTINVSKASTVLSCIAILGNNGAGKGFTKIGPGRFALYEGGTYDGPTVIADGTLEVANAIASSRITLQAGTSLEFHARDNGSPVFTMPIEGTGTVTISGDGSGDNTQNRVVLNTIGSGNTFSGSMIVGPSGKLAVWSGGGNAIPDDLTVQLEGDISIYDGKSETLGGLTGSGTVHVGNGTSTIVVSNTADQQFAGRLLEYTTSPPNVTGVLNFVKTAGGVFTLLGSNKYSGVTEIRMGTLKVGNGGASGALGSGAVLNNGRLLFNRGGSLVLPNMISGTGSVENAGPGSITMLGLGTYSGPTRCLGGTTIVNGALSGAGAVAISSGALLRGTGTISGTITCDGCLAPGAIPGEIGQIALVGVCSLSTGSVLQIDVGATNRSDRISVIGNLVLGGTMRVDALPNFTPEIGAVYTAATASVTSGTFASTNLPFLPAQLEWAVDYTPNTLILRIQQKPPETGFAAWVSSITNGLTNAQDCATHDGFPNLLKYATGSNPTNSDRLPLLDMTMSSGGPLLKFHRNTNATDVKFIVEAGTNIERGATWDGIATNLNGSWGDSSDIIEDGAGTPVTVSVKDTAPVTDGRYLRLRIGSP